MVRKLIFFEFYLNFVQIKSNDYRIAHEDDSYNRLKLMSQQLIANSNLLHSICFSGEYTFLLNDLVNTQNCK